MIRTVVASIVVTYEAKIVVVWGSTNNNNLITQKTKNLAMKQ
jgi:hypothetical protein